jgi:hypothetical protein
MIRYGPENLPKKLRDIADNLEKSNVYTPDAVLVLNTAFGMHIYDFSNIEERNDSFTVMALTRAIHKIVREQEPG